MNDLDNNVISLKKPFDKLNGFHNNYAKASYHCLCASQYYKKADELYRNHNIVECHENIHTADRHLKIADYYRRRGNNSDHIFKPLEIIELNDLSNTLDII